VVLYKLTTLNEPGWDTTEISRSTDVFRILDLASDTLGRVVSESATVDPMGRAVDSFKTQYVFAAI
jgi:hypothetical protein